MRPIIRQFIFGIDTMIALASYLFFVVFLNAEPSPGLMTASLVLAYLPDLDLIPFFVFRRKFGWKSHWVIAHHPIILIPSAIAISASLSGPIGILPWQAGLLAALNVTAHLFHDGCDPVGFVWLSPFSQKRFRFRNGRFVPAAREDIRKKYDQSDPSNPLGHEIALRLENIPRLQIAIALLVISATIVSFF